MYLSLSIVKSNLHCGVLGALMTQLYPLTIPVPALFRHAPSVLNHPLLYLAFLSYFFRFSKTNTINELLC